MIVCAACARTAGVKSTVDQVRLLLSAVSFNVSEEPHSLNPLLARSDDERQLAHLAFDMLLDVDSRGRQVPDLAVAVPTVANGGVSSDGLTIVYHLRGGVRWQDGAPFSSRDVRFTWLAIVDPRNQIPSARGYDTIESIETPAPLTAVVRLKRRWAPAVATFFTYGTAPMPIVPTTRPVFGSSRLTVPSSAFVTQTAPAPTATATGRLPTPA